MHTCIKYLLTLKDCRDKIQAYLYEVPVKEPGESFDLSPGNRRNPSVQGKVLTMSSLQQSAVAVTTTIAYTFGQEDARAGQIACPEMCLTHRSDMLDYCRGFESIAGPTITTRQFLTDAQIEAEAQDYADDIADREWHSRGAW
jgi:hypothetical protein